MLLAALPPSWRPFVTTQSYQTQTIAVLINKMRQENTFSKLSNGTMNQPIAPMAMATSLHKPNPHQRPNYYSRPQYNTNKPNQPHCNYCQRQGHWEKDCRIKARNSNYQSNTQITCNYCKRIGHMERECRTKQREVNMQPQTRMAQIQEETSSGDEMYLFNLNLTNTTGVDSAWYLDTGATHHMTYDKTLLAEFKELPTPLEVHLGDDSIREAKGFGTITFNLPNNKHLQIPKVYFVPGLTKNLISVSQETQSGFTITFKGNSCILQPQLHDSTPIVISCPQFNNLYPIPLKVITMFNASHQILDNVSENTLKWHYWLGHPHLQVLYTLQNQDLIQGIAKHPNHLPLCEACLLGKMTSNHYLRSANHTTDVLQLVHTDLCGPMPTPSRETFISLLSSMISLTLLLSPFFVRNPMPYPTLRSTKPWLKTNSTRNQNIKK